MPLQEDYQVTLDAFHGPLDLLLFLIRRAEVDIHDIPIAAVTEQYLAFLKQIESIDIDAAAEFLVMAASLIEIKSRMIAPAADEDGEGDPASLADGEGGDPRYELVQQLLAYQKYRVASEELDQRREEFFQRFAFKPTRAKREDEEDQAEPVEIELDDAHVMDLFEAYERIMESIDFSKLGDHTVEIDDTPLALHEEDLLDRLQRVESRQITLQEAFEGRTRGQIIGLFLATLELVRLRKVIVKQDEICSEIMLALNADPDEALFHEEQDTPQDTGSDAPTPRA